MVDFVLVQVQLTLMIHALSISSCIFIRWSHLNAVNMFLKVYKILHTYSMQAFGSPNLVFASVSGSLNKPKPLNLNVSFPSIGDLQWSFARMLYLFNTQVERNVAT